VYQVLTPWNMTRLPFRCSQTGQNSWRYMRLADELQLFPLYTEENCILAMTKQNYVPSYNVSLNETLRHRFIPPVYYDYWWKTFINKSTVHSSGWDYDGVSDKNTTRLVDCNQTMVLPGNHTSYPNCQKENWYFHLFGTRTDVLFDRCYFMQETVDKRRPHQECKGNCQMCGGL
jgi:hypothetical protein